MTKVTLKAVPGKTVDDVDEVFDVLVDGKTTKLRVRWDFEYHLTKKGGTRTLFKTVVKSDMVMALRGIIDGLKTR